MSVGQDLHLDVAGVEHRLLEVQRRVPERGLGLAGRCLDGLGQRGDVSDAPHAASAPAGDRLDEQRKLHRRSDRHQFIGRRRRRRRVQYRQPGGAGRGDRPRFIARQLKDFRVGSDERDARGGTGCGQVRVFRQEAVARIDRVGAGLLGDADDFVDRKIRPDGVALLADLVRLVGLEPVQGVAILIRIDRDRRDAHLVGRPERANRDLAAVRYQDLRNHPLTLTADDAVVSK